MAQFDSSIALQVQPVRDPLESYGKVQSLKALANQQRIQENQLADYDQQKQEGRTLADLYKGALGPDGTLNRNAVLTGAAQQGLGARIPAMQKSFAEADKAQGDVTHQAAQTDETKLKVQKQKVDLAGSAISSLLANPNVTHDQVIMTVNNLVNQGVIAPDQGAQMVRMLPGNPQALRQFLVQKGLETAEASKRMELTMPKVQGVNLGGVTQMVDQNPLTNPGLPGQSFAHTQTPDSIASNATTRRGQDITRDAVLQGGSVQVDGSGNMVMVPNKFTPGSPVQAAPVVGQGGAPLKGKDGGGPKISSEVQRQIGGVISFDKDLSALEEALKNFNPRNPGDQANTTKRAQIQSLAKQAQLSAKEAAALGALSGPDMALLEGILNDPTSIKGVVSGSSGLAAQITEARAGNKRRVSSLEQQYGPKASDGFPAELKTPAVTTPKLGAADSGYVFVGGDPANPASWKKQ